jgi:acetyl esterase/lipase
MKQFRWMKPGPLCLLWTILVFSPCACQEHAPVWGDINYADDSLVGHRMDIYLPETGTAPHPAVIIVYGSAFFGDDLKKTAFNTLGEPLLQGGFAVVAINHRSSRNAIFPAQIQDVKAAVRFIRARGTQLQIDTSFIGITGYSSGGHLSALAGTSRGAPHMALGSESVDLEGDVGSYTGFDSSVDAVVDWFGPIDFPSMDSCGSSMVHNAPDSPESILIGGPIQDHRERCALANPMTYIDALDPPFLILHGDKDPLVPHCQSAMLHDALKKAGVPSEYKLVPNAKHGPGLFEEKYFQRMGDFFQAALKEKQKSQ